MFILSALFNRLIRKGILHVIDAKGRLHIFSGEKGPEVTIRFHTNKIERAILLSPELGIGEGYMNGSLTIEKGTLFDFLNICTLSFQELNHSHFPSEYFSYPFRKLHQYNTFSRASKNVKHHCVRFYLRDYRQETGIYDRIVSVGMFEHRGTVL